MLSHFHERQETRDTEPVRCGRRACHVDPPAHGTVYSQSRNERGSAHVSSQFARAVTRAAYGARQLPRVAWYVGHSLVLRELADSVRQSEKSKVRRRHVHTDAPVPDRRRIYADMAKLFLRDLANVEAGIYPVPEDHDGSLFALVRRSRMFFDDLPNIHQRRKRRAHSEILNDATRGKRPRYYLQNFHYQSGGWMTDDSAELYDTQVEVLFNGSANAIRRQALPQLHDVFAGRDQRKLSLMDVGCGTGRFLDSVKQVWPRLPIFGIDMSEAYVIRKGTPETLVANQTQRRKGGGAARWRPKPRRPYKHIRVPRIAAAFGDCAKSSSR
jgi:hypothetical protein